jgi:sterol desaturase/sphingolipid hydroxylase (fatty acid hydroxylase superfamily)
MTAILFVLWVAMLERVPALCFRPARLWRAHASTDLVYLVTGFGVGGTLAMTWVRAAGGWVDGHTRLGVLWGAVPFPAQVALALVALDLGNYLVHWALHRSDVLWEFHKAHHSSRHLDWLATFRSHAVEQLLRRVLAPVVLIATGAPMDAVGAAAAVFFAWATLNHANLRPPLGFLEGVIVTPRLHRVHHVVGTTERNLGTILTCWDRLRGTFVRVDPSPDAAFGLPGEVATYPQDWLGQLVAPVVRGRTTTMPSPAA